jgi:hypothetical protein
VESRIDYLSALPGEILLKIADTSPTAARINLSRTSTRFPLFFFDEHKPALNLLRQLLDHGALGELEDAESLWKLFPDLLTCRGTIYHPNRIYVAGQAPVDIPFHQNPGRYKYIKYSFYKILLANSEFEEAEKVGHLMTQEEKQKQFYEVFPDGEIKKYNFDLEEAKRLLQTLFDAVAKDESLKIERDEDGNIKNIIMSDSTREALYKLYVYAKPKSEHDIGLVFDPAFYHEALKLYDEKCGQFKQKWDRYPFWNICVEEWLAGCLGTGFLRPHSQGLGNPLTRRGCVLADGSSGFAFRRTADSLPGYHLFVGYYGRERGRPWARRARGGGSTFSKLMSDKNESRDRLYAAICAPRSIAISDSLK